MKTVALAFHAARSCCGRLAGQLRALILVLCLPGAAAAQSYVAPEHGLVAVAGGLRGLGSVKRVLVIGAHPDDEDTSLLALLVRGMGADAAYLSLNRGEGGQNLLGPELDVGLGLLRTEELLAARQLDGADQFFTRAYDFGYSKSVEETFHFWPEDSLLADLVYVVRRYRPQVIVSIFKGTRRDGHGQHQAAGILAREAFDAAADPDRFPEQLVAAAPPWTPLKLYRSTRFDSAATTLEIETGQLDLLYGRSYHQIAMAGRSQHRSQDMGRIESLGPTRTRLELLESRVPGRASDAEPSLFDGVDTTLAGLVDWVEERSARRELSELVGDYRSALERARRALTGPPGRQVVSALSQALSVLRRAVAVASRAGPGAEPLSFVLRDDSSELESVLTEAAGLIIEAFADDDLLVPGQSLELEVQIWNGGGLPVELRELSLKAPRGWDLQPLDGAGGTLAPGTLTRRRFRLELPDDAPPSRPYFLQAPRSGGLYRWPPDDALRARPFGPPLVEAEAELVIAGASVRRAAAAVYRFADQALGEVRRPLHVVPAVGLGVTPPVTVHPLGRHRSLRYSVTLRGEAPDGVRGRVWLELPEGWSSLPRQAAFDLAGPGRSAILEFDVSAKPGVGGSYPILPVAQTEDGRRHRLGYSIVDYPHVRRQLVFEEAAARVEAFELSVDTSRRVAYVPGAGDAVADAITALGLQVDVLDERAISAADLSLYDVVVLGIRAYETNLALVSSNDRLLGWVRAGGTLISQYQQYRYFEGNFAPYPLSARFPHDRVSDESAPVELLVPEHALFVRPNRITPEDFEGWVQERGLYFAHEWDARYRPLLQTADPGEAPQRGALLVAPYGEGLYVYTGLALFRQLPAGLPGAFRLLANLLSLER